MAWRAVGGGTRVRVVRTIRTRAAGGAPLLAGDPKTGSWNTYTPGGVLRLIQADGTISRLTTQVALADANARFDGDCVFRARIEYRDHKRWDTGRDFTVELAPPSSPRASRSPAVASGEGGSFSIEVDFGSEVAGGTLTQWCRAPWRNPATGETGVIEGFGPSWTIAGVNPDPRDVMRRLGRLEHQAVAFQESAFQQFWPDGTPKWGKPNGFGVMQIDNSPPPTSRQIWDWRANVDDGLRRVSGTGGTVAQARGFPSRLRKRLKDATIPDFTDAELWMEAWQRYNGGWAANTDPAQGAYWRWSADDRRWIAHPPNGYAQMVSTIVERVRSGNPPVGWPTTRRARGGK